MATTTSVARPLPVAGAQWTSCANGLQCASVTVPLNYAYPEGQTIEIAIARHRATGTKIGSIVINPGGPGESGINDLPAELDILSPELIDHFDIVSFDPRGVGESSPVYCTASHAPNLASTAELPDPFPETTADIKSYLANVKTYDEQCEQYAAGLLANVGTDNVARDLDRIRQAIGDPKLTYIGHSYGTLIGALYAQMFPTHVRAMVLDSDINPALSATQFALGQADSFESDFASFAFYCDATPTCALHGDNDIIGQTEQLLSSSVTKAISAGNGREVGPGEIINTLLDCLYTSRSWPVLGAALAAAFDGQGSDVAQISDEYEAGNTPNLDSANAAINCIDHPVAPSIISQLPALAAQAAKTAPVFGPVLIWSLAQCAYWPARPGRVAAPVHDVGAPPILITATSGDPATPYAWGVALSKQLSGAVLVTFKGYDHVAYYYSACVRSFDAAYLLNLTLPPAGSVCSD